MNGCASLPCQCTQHGRLETKRDNKEPGKEGEGEGERERNEHSQRGREIYKGGETSQGARGRAKQKPAKGHSTLQVRSLSLGLECRASTGILLCEPSNFRHKGAGSSRGIPPEVNPLSYYILVPVLGIVLCVTKLHTAEESNSQFLQYYLTCT